MWQRNAFRIPITKTRSRLEHMPQSVPLTNLEQNTQS
jgi:hypothetical protein